MRADVYSAETKGLKIFSGLHRLRQTVEEVFYGLLALVLEPFATPYYPDFSSAGLCLRLRIPGRRN